MYFKKLVIFAVIIFMLFGCSNTTQNNTSKEYETFYMGAYEQDGNLLNGEEDIEWVIINKTSDTITAISKYGLDNVVYNANVGITSWENSSLRDWLNNTFYINAFEDAEKASIVSNQGDYVSILSVEEASSYFDNDDERSAIPTSYAMENGAHTYETQNLCWWWLKDVYAGQFVANVRTAGNISTDPNVYVDDEGYTARPVICIKADTELKKDSANKNNPNIEGKVNKILFSIKIEDEDIGVYNNTSNDRVWKKNVFYGAIYHVYENKTIDNVVWYRIGNGEWIKDSDGTRVSIVVEK